MLLEAKFSFFCFIMLTPKFTITQDAEFVFVTIKVPYIRVSSAELITEDCTFTFYCKPYLLKLTFPFPFKEEDEESKATYDPFNDNGTLVAHLPKLEVGQHFPNLDLTSKLLYTSKTASNSTKNSSIPSIQVLQSEDYEAGSQMDEEHDKIQYSSQILNYGTGDVRYGFNNLYSKIFIGMRDELLDMTEIKHPDQILPKYRPMLRISCENQLFDPARYLGDQLDGELDPIYMEAMSFRSFYNVQWDAWKDRKTTVSRTGEATTATAASIDFVDPRDRAFELAGGFTEHENEILSSKLPRKEYLFTRSDNEQFGLLLGLADILFAHCYDHRITLGDGNVESAHTIARLSCTFSWLEDFSLSYANYSNTPMEMDEQLSKADVAANAKESNLSSGELQASKAREEAVSNVIKFNLRRCMIYPYMRVWKLARKVLADVARILFLGRRAILKCLLQLRSTFEHTDTHYLLNTIYVDDYCNWLQQHEEVLSEEALQAFAKTYNVAKGSIEKLSHTGKELMGFFLPDIEAWAAAFAKEEVEEGEEEEEGESESDSESERDDQSSSESESESGGSSDGASDANDNVSVEGVTLHAKERNLVQSSEVGGDSTFVNTLPAPAEAEVEPMSGLPTQSYYSKNESQSSAMAEEEAEWSVPAQFTDYSDLQRRDPVLRYLVPDAADEFDLLGGGNAGVVGFCGHVSDQLASSAGESGKGRAINKLLLLPKRKAEAEAQLEELIAGVSARSGGVMHYTNNNRYAGESSVGGNGSKRVLIEEIASEPVSVVVESDSVMDDSVDVSLSQLSIQSSVNES